jgi:hypothetical protein
MADTRSSGSFRRYVLYALAAVPIAAVIVAVSAALEASQQPMVSFDMKLKVSGQDIRAQGTAYVEDGAFSFEADKLSFTGAVSGDEVRISGKVANEDRSQMRDFGASGHLTNGQMSATLNGDRGSRIGTLKLELINR